MRLAMTYGANILEEDTKQRTQHHGRTMVYEEQAIVKRPANKYSVEGNNQEEQE